MAALAPDIARSFAKLLPGTLENLLPHLRHLREVLDAARES
ncbi:MAG: hypothetical protein ACXIT4_05905 [Erythrobacter sp.]